MAQILKQAETSAIGTIQKLFSNAVTDDKDLKVLRGKKLGHLRLLGVNNIQTQAIEER